VCGPCTSTSQCPMGQTCGGGVCGSGCNTTADCTNGEACISLTCAPCTASSQCTSLQVCVSGACQTCTNSSQCLSGDVCSGGACVSACTTCMAAGGTCRAGNMPMSTAVVVVLNIAPGGSCTPESCVQQGLECGPAGDGCGGVVECGQCPAPGVCGAG